MLRISDFNAFVLKLGEPRRKRQKGRNRWKAGKDCGALSAANTRPLQSRTHRGCRRLAWLCTGMGPLAVGLSEGGKLRGPYPSLTAELFAIPRSRERGSHCLLTKWVTKQTGKSPRLEEDWQGGGRSVTGMGEVRDVGEEHSESECIIYRYETVETTKVSLES